MADGCGQPDPSCAPRPPGRFALHDLAEADDAAGLTALLSVERSFESPGPDVDERDGGGCTPLHCGVIACAGNALAPLLAAGANTRLKCNGSPLLHLVVAVGGVPANAPFVSAALAQLLFCGSPPPLTATDDSGRTVAHLAASLGDVPSLAALSISRPTSVQDTP